MKNKIALQTVFWIIVLAINIALWYRFDDFRSEWLDETAYIICYGFVFYFNVLYLFPKYYSTKGEIYFLFSILLILFFTIAGPILNGLIYYLLGHHRIRWFRSTEVFTQSLWLILIYLAGTVYSIQEMLNKQIKRNQKITEEKLETELQLLKNQINPHFLFNALNNIYSLSYTKSDRAPESILKLSDMLRYVIEDCSKDHVTLNEEIAYIINLVDFYKMKSPEKRNIKLSYKVDHPGLSIAPMLFIPFVENSFKYSRIEEDPSGFIDITLNENNNTVIFAIQNSIFSKRTILQGSGQGISNVKQRLDIIYPQQHSLTIEGDDKAYYLELKIDLV
ncbi:MAG: sensor histidine kinase [Bacteroidales bacterium]|nr:sensor histidine kinase [Bacteroidales bacterium]